MTRQLMDPRNASIKDPIYSRYQNAICIKKHYLDKEKRM